MATARSMTTSTNWNDGSTLQSSASGSDFGLKKYQNKDGTRSYNTVRMWLGRTDPPPTHTHEHLLLTCPLKASRGLDTRPLTPHQGLGVRRQLAKDGRREIWTRNTPLYTKVWRFADDSWRTAVARSGHATPHSSPSSSSSSSSIPSPRGSLGHHRWFCNQFSPFFLVLHCPLGLAELQPVHSLMLSSHLFLCPPCLLPPFTVPCKMVLARPDERETWPYHYSLRLLMIVRRSLCGSIACWILAWTSSLVTLSLYEMCSILQ